MALATKIVPLFLIIWSFQWQENIIEASSGYDALFTQDNVQFWGASGGKTDAQSSRLKRDVDTKCVIDDIDAKFELHEHHHKFNDSNFSLMLLWAGNDGRELIALSTLEYAFFAAQSKLWVSRDFGQSFKDINSLIDQAIIKKNGGLFRSPLDPKKMILISYSENMDRSSTKMYITTDAANSFKKVDTPFYLDGPLHFHPQENKWILAHATYQDFKLFLSKDFGLTWESIRKNVVDFSWGTKEMDNDLIYIVVDDVDPSKDKDPQEGEYRLMRSKDSGRSFEVIKKRMFNYGVQGKFLYVAIADEKDPKNRILEVSVNQGSSWNSTHLPVIAHDRFFSILDMNEGMVFMHVDDPGNTGAGTIYTSDSDGIIFSKSLEKHLFPNGGSITDFYRVDSMRGVYLASQMGKDDTIHTMVTFDRGGIWSSVRAPEGMTCKEDECNLQIHNQFSKSKGVGNPMGPFSKENAQGLLLAHGHVSDALEVSPPDVFVSSDGGYTWVKALDGPHHYTITNHGGLILAVEAGAEPTDTVKFSYDEGHCWNQYKFAKDKNGKSDPIRVTGILPEPSAKSLNVSIWGFGVDDHQWRAFTIDFSAVLERKCTHSDYINWMPHEDNQHSGCLLGLSESFEKVKPDSRCQLDPNYVRVREATPCPCNKADYECDFGYERENNEEECDVSPDVVQNLEVCINGREEEIKTLGYRKIPGDVCNGGFEPSRDVEKLKQKCHEYGMNYAAKPHKSGAAGVVIFLLIVAVACGLLFILYKRKQLRIPCLKKSDVKYSYRALSQTADLDRLIDLDNESKEHTYHDTSDEDMIE